jgi:hypothetical protein
MMDLKGEASVWPDNARFLDAWRMSPVYLWLKPATRLEYLLAQLEVRARRVENEDIKIPKGLTIEHVLPQSWYDHWLLKDGTRGKTPVERLAVPSPASEQRDRVLHTIGNLTLLTGKLNNDNRNYELATKVELIEGYSLLALNKYFQKRSVWDEETIDDRARKLFEDAVTLWPYPAALSTWEPEGEPAMVAAPA